MADFKSAIPYILENEGGYANLKGDSGGRTYMGVSENNFPSLQLWSMLDYYMPLANGKIVDDAAITAFVNNFYYKQFWCNIKGDGIDSQEVATYILDWYVNSGKYAIEHVQALLGIADDGIFGNGTLNALNEAGEILDKIHASRTEYVNKIGAIHPEFLHGWLNRINNLYSKLST